MTLYNAVTEAVGFDVPPDTPVEDPGKLAAAHEVESKDSSTAGEIVLALFEQFVSTPLSSRRPFAAFYSRPVL